MVFVITMIVMSLVYFSSNCMLELMLAIYHTASEACVLTGFFMQYVSLILRELIPYFHE